MAAFRLTLCFLISALCFCSLINAAAVHKLLFEGKLQDGTSSADETRSEAAGIISVENGHAFPESIRERRSNFEGTCHHWAPCGWAVYEPFTRRVEYFLKNTCSCQTSHKCIRTDDDLSISAYVYRCRSNVSATDIESP
ncbi:uncharacterized protein [Neodiprion pinetum]|uniref:Uncharacterized protein LOC107220792 n=1 Tax=Neodiprion lecontei TaxID=441921 RepID=A0A6J0BMH2_NEOLC|nr:uncharacterized protein LOC107220792 [Neodiprion lecontei]XP_046466051.1 uncharacterized protein LOC124211245 [Neodiprion pinetum]